MTPSSLLLKTLPCPLLSLSSSSSLLSVAIIAKGNSLYLGLENVCLYQGKKKCFFQGMGKLFLPGKENAFSARVFSLKLWKERLSTLTNSHNKRSPLLGEMSPVTLFKPGSSWKELLIDPALVGLFFKVPDFVLTIQKNIFHQIEQNLKI